ncbi:MAG: hypothetical protein J6S14_17520 [Clostridia bacterium]|nr:hypothetical protein [Clostridia bacterium]
MSSRRSESYIAAVDTNGRAHFVGYTYDYSGGHYHSITQLGGHLYEIESDGDEYNTIKGERLPRLWITDLSSFFTAKPTINMSKAIALAELTDCSITQLFLVHDDGEYIGCYSVSATGEQNVGFDTEDVPKEIFGESIEDIFNDILVKGIDGYAEYLNSVRQK